MSNKDLTNITFLESLGFNDVHYLKMLCQSIWEFIKNAPIPITTEIYENNYTFFLKFHIGKNNYTYEIDNTVSYFDFIFRFKMNALKHYPQFEFEEEVEIELDTEEMLEKVAKENISLNDAVFLTKKIKQKQKGIILKVMLVQDEFLFEYNNKKYVRTSLIGESIDEVLPVKKFLQNVRNMYYNKEDGLKIRDYIFNNSKIIKELPKEENEVIIDYPKDMMINFFKIHYQYMENISLEKQFDLVHKWGKFKIVFQDEYIEQECIEYYRKRKMKKN
jgi:hypothetical protein